MSSELKKPWADGPYALLEAVKTQEVPIHPALHIANEMVHAHNCMIRGLNAISLQYQQVKSPQDVKDFLCFTLFWAEFIHHHHHLEEQIIFPGMETALGKPGLMGGNVEQHEAFGPILRGLIEYAGDPRSAETYGGGEALGQHLAALGPPLHEHLAAEIPTLTALKEACGGDQGKKQGLLAAYEAGSAEAARSQAKVVVPPMVLGLRDKTFDGGNNWPSIPTPVEFIIGNVLGWKHSNVWRFLPCDYWGQPRDLAFAREGL
ncbi:hypothetical protein BX600DRAFT_516788 [Xylariales sp. PMI_506]|nr:hypothetical protein BX600DRAFT_516788 [Xylariales sp. PMI_506]